MLAVFLRFYHLDSYPALNADEAAIGYNAYSLLETGKDEHGNPWPIHFQSFNDYKPGLYFYLVLPFVKYLGLNVLSVRIPGALIGVLTVLAVYFLTEELFKHTKKILINNYQSIIGATASLFLAISPWHIQFSRGGWEANVSTFFIVCGVLFFLKARKNSKILILSSLFFILSLYTYHAARIVVPLLGIGLIVIYKNDLIKSENVRAIILNSLFIIFVLLPLGLDLTRGTVLSRAAGVSLFADPGVVSRINEQRGEHTKYEEALSHLFHNKPINYTLAFLGNWGKHYSGEFLFFTGDEIQRNKVPETGQMYLLDILFLAAGLIAIFKNYSLNPRPYTLILFWLIVAPTAAALTFQSPHALRAQNMVIPLVIISAYGLISLSLSLHHILDNKKLLNLIYLVFVLALSWNFTRYLHQYYFHMSKEYPFSSQYGVSELVSYIGKESDQYDKIVVSDKYDQPYILFLFYGATEDPLKYSPAKFQSDHALTRRDIYGFSTVNSFDKFVFKKIDFEEDRKEYPKSLIVGSDNEIPDEANIVTEIYGTNGYKYFQVVAN